MSTVAEIKEAISTLTLEERVELASFLQNWPDDAWDKQMQHDAAAGKFSTLNREADAAHAAGKTVPLNDILREP